MANEEMKEGWNGTSGAEWVRLHESYDRMLAPWADLLAGAADVQPGERVLDLGCGNGVTTRAAAVAAGPEGGATGVDLSGPMLDQARKRAAEEGVDNVDFVQADVQTDPLGPDAGRYDVVISRFGVMFFDDPVAAFANVRSAMRPEPGGRLAIVSWAPMDGQQWLLVPMGAALAHLPPPTITTAADAPGMFGLATAERAHQVLEAAGWTGVATRTQAGSMLVGGGGSLDDTIDYLRHSGPGRALFDGADPEPAAAALDAIRTALSAHLTDEGVVLEGVARLTTALAS